MRHRVLLLLSVTVGGCAAPLAPGVSTHKAIYRIYLGDPQAVQVRRAEWPSGVYGLSPQDAARRFNAPIQAGPTVSPPGILIDYQGYPFDPAVSDGEIAPSQVPYLWVGYFY